MNRYFTSDTHVYHGNIIKYCKRPFLAEIDKRELERIGAWHNGVWKGEGSSNWRMSEEAVQTMTDTLIAETNAIVGEDDILYHLGDVGMAPKPGSSKKRWDRYYDEVRYYRDRIKCRTIHLVWGNHDDYCIRDLFTTTDKMMSVHVPGLGDLELCHYLMGIWNGSHRYVLNLYGHSHAEAEDFWDKMFPQRRQMDVGVDNAYRLLGKFRPFSVEEIKRFIGHRTGVYFDHHTPRDQPHEAALN